MEFPTFLPAPPNKIFGLGVQSENKWKNKFKEGKKGNIWTYQLSRIWKFQGWIRYYEKFLRLLSFNFHASFEKVASVINTFCL